MKEFLLENIGNTVQIHGSIHKIRRMSGFAFVLLRTREEIIQCVYGEEFSQFPLSLLKEEACVSLSAQMYGAPLSSRETFTDLFRSIRKA